MDQIRNFGNNITGNRQYNHQFNDQSRSSIIALWVAGQSYGKIAKTFNCGKTSIFNIIKRYKDTGESTPAPRSGAPNKLSKANVRYLNIQVKRERSIPIFKLRQQAAALGIDVSTKTISRVMRPSWGHKWRRKKRILLTKASSRKRLRFALEWAPKVEELIKVFRYIKALYLRPYTKIQL
jgi:transposase